MPSTRRFCELLSIYGAETAVKPMGRGAEGIPETAPGTYDAVLMDIQMPEMNGYEATRRIRRLERPDAWEIPAVAMTANAFVEDVREAMDAGMTAHVAKPIDVEVLRETLKKVLIEKKE
ncbi:MAG: response regulator [Eisenbergiella sp.]